MNINSRTAYDVYAYDTVQSTYHRAGTVYVLKNTSDSIIQNTITEKFPNLPPRVEFRFAPAGTSVQSKYQEKNMIKSTINSASTLQAAASASKFVVGSFDVVSGFSMSATPTLHDTAVLARGEAARLAKLNPGKYYVFLQIRGGEFVKPEPAVTSF